MIFDTNATNTFTLILTNLNMTLIEGIKENKIINYSTFSERRNKDIDNFINDLKKIFIINKIVNN